MYGCSEREICPVFIIRVFRKVYNESATTVTFETDETSPLFDNSTLC